MNVITAKYTLSENSLLVSIGGEIDHHSASALREEIDTKIAEIKPKTLILDLKSVGFMDSSGLGLILGRYTKMKELGGQIKVLNPGSGAARVLKLSAADKIIPDHDFKFWNSMGTGSTDMGDLSCIMPAIHPYIAGSAGAAHGSDYEICDPIKACVDSAKFQLAMLTMLLSDNAARARKIIEEFEPQFTKEEFLQYQDSLNSCGDRIEYTDSGAKVTI